MKNKKNAAFYGVSLALALLMGYVEHLFSFDIGVPGVKIGLANIVTVIFLYLFSFKATVAVSMPRVMISSLLFGNVVSLAYGLTGCLLSLSAMYAAKKTNRLSIIGVSALGGVFHNAGQISAASLIMGSSAVFAYMPVLIAAGVFAGVAVGILAAIIVRRLGKSNILP